jgi:uncharacterized membrane protein
VSHLELVIKIGWAVLPNLALGVVGLITRVFDRSVFVIGLLLGTLVTYAFGLGGFAVLLGFVLLAVVTGRMRFGEKRVQPTEGRPGRVWAWRSGLSNLGVPAFGAAIALASPGPVLKVFFTAALAAAAFDTAAAEMGKAFPGRTLTLHDMKVVRAGSEAGAAGGLSGVGMASGMIAATALAMIALGFHLVGAAMAGYVVLSAILAAVAQSLLKSVVGLRSPYGANVINTLLGGLLAALFWTGVGTM